MPFVPCFSLIASSALERREQLRECRAWKTGWMTTAHFNSHTDWSVRLRLMKTVTQNLLLKACCNLRFAFSCTDFCKIDFKFGCQLLEIPLCLIFCCFSPDKVSHFGDKFLCRHQLLAYIYRHTTLQYILNDFSSGVVECKVVQLSIIFPVFWSEYLNSTIHRWMLNSSFTLITSVSCALVCIMH